MDLLKYNGLVIAMSDNTKLKKWLRYLFLLGCIVSSILPLTQTYVISYDDIYTIIDQIKKNNVIVIQVHVYLLQIYKIILIFLFKKKLILIFNIIRYHF